MDDSHDQNKNQTEGAQQGIFSTPELTVDTEKIAEGTEAAAEASRAKIASIFANTETGQQAQRLNDAMVANSEPATEDIVINNGPKKKSKLPIALAVLVLIAAVGGVVGYFMVQKRTGTSAMTALSLFQDYASYAKFGPQDEDRIDQSSGVWYIDNLYDSDLTTAEVSSFLDGLNARYRDFLGQNRREDLSEGLILHQQLLAALTNYYSLNKYDSELTNKYLREGDDVAQDYIDEVAPAVVVQDGDSESLLDMAANLEHDYLNTRLIILRRYRIHGCISGTELDIVCTLDNTDFQTQQEEQSANEVRSALASLVPLIQDDYHTSVEAILNILEQA